MKVCHRHFNATCSLVTFKKALLVAVDVPFCLQGLSGGLGSAGKSVRQGAGGRREEGGGERSPAAVQAGRKDDTKNPPSPQDSVRTPASDILASASSILRPQPICTMKRCTPSCPSRRLLSHSQVGRGREAQRIQRPSLIPTASSQPHLGHTLKWTPLISSSLVTSTSHPLTITSIPPAQVLLLAPRHGF